MKRNFQEIFRNGLLIAALPLMVAPQAIAETDVPAEDSPAAALARLLEIVQKRTDNLAAQEKAWPNRAQDQLNERPAPARVLKLTREVGALNRRLKGEQARLTELLSDDLGPALEALAAAENLAQVGALLPPVVQAGREDLRTTRILITLARRFDGAMSIVRALGDIGTEEAGLFLLELATKERRLAVLKAAGDGGQPAVIGRLIELADGDDKDLARLCLRAIGKLVPPREVNGAGHSKPAVSDATHTGTLVLKKLSAGISISEQLEELVANKIGTVHSRELKTALIIYLGLFRNEANYPFLKSVYSSSTDAHGRLAAISAMGNLGPAAGEFLLEELATETNPLAVRRSCIHALAACRYRPGVPTLLELLSDRRLKRDAARALARISGRRLAANRAAWRRWWRSQPEAKSVALDE